jgi:hypothetical protein
VTVTNAATTLAQFESVALIRTGSDAWTLVPFSGGVSNADFSDAATGTYTDSGIDYKYITYTASGTLTVTTAGFADILVIGGGGGAGGIGGGGGAGGYLSASNVYFAAGTATVVVGAGGAGNTSGLAGNNGISSRIGDFYGVGGGSGAGNGGGSRGINGGSGGGAALFTSARTGGAGTSGQGNTAATMQAATDQAAAVAAPVRRASTAPQRRMLAATVAQVWLHQSQAQQ